MKYGVNLLYNFKLSTGHIEKGKKKLMKLITILISKVKAIR